MSTVARVPEVRAALLERQRELAADGGIVMAGRDIGTVVLPDADLKLFLDASVEERARRRIEERGLDPDGAEAEEVREQLRVRDAIDTGREVAPLRAADDAVHVVTDGNAFDETVEIVAAEIAGVMLSPLSAGRDRSRSRAGRPRRLPAGAAWVRARADADDRSPHPRRPSPSCARGGRAAEAPEAHAQAGTPRPPLWRRCRRPRRARARARADGPCEEAAREARCRRRTAPVETAAAATAGSNAVRPLRSSDSSVSRGVTGGRSGRSRASPPEARRQPGRRPVRCGQRRRGRPASRGQPEPAIPGRSPSPRRWRPA